MSGLVSVQFVYKSSLKMVAPHANDTIVEQQAVICFVWSGVKMSEIYRAILAQYEHCVAQKNLQEWVERLKHGKTMLDDDERSAWPSTY